MLPGWTSGIRFSAINLSAFLFVGLFLLPTHLKKLDFRIYSKSLLVTVKQTSPAFSALSDISLRAPSAKPQPKPAETIILTSGKKWRFAQTEETPVVPIHLAREFKPLVISVSQQLEKSLDVDAGARVIVSAPKEQKILEAEVDHRLPIRDLLPPEDNQIAGHIKLGSGLAYSPRDHILTISRLEGGKVVDQGQVDPEKGLFQLNSADGKGELVAEMWDRSGEVLGRGVVAIQNAKGPISAAEIEIKPLQTGASGRVVAVNSFGSLVSGEASSIVEIENVAYNLRSDETGGFKEIGVDSESTFVARASKQNQLMALSFGKAGQNLNLMLFPDSLYVDLKKLLNRSERMGRVGMIWGRVVDSRGRPVENAQVELAGEEPATPVYFAAALGDFLPDPDRVKTSSNGLFAFLDLKPGVYFAKASREGEEFISEIAPVEEHSVTQVEIASASSSAPATIPGQIVDLLSNQGRPGSVLLAEENLDWKTDKIGRFWFDVPKKEGFSLLEIDPGAGYQVSRVLYHRSKDEIVLPAIREDWLYGVMRNAGAAQSPELGIAVGYVDGDGYEVVLPQEQEDAKVIYFDATGQPLAKPLGVSGGGFVISNLRPGLTTLRIIPENGNRSRTEIIWVDPKSVSALTALF